MPPDDSCIRCGYALAGLPADALCPECAYPAARSRDRTRLLRSADQPWLATTSRGLRDLSLALYTLVIGFVVFLAVALVEELLSLRIGFVRRGGPGLVLFALLALASAALHIRGCILLSRPTHPEYALPSATRLAVLICGTLLPISVGVSLFGGQWFIGRPWAESAFVLAAQVNAMLFLFAMHAATRHLEERTSAWSGEVERRQRNTRRNLIGFAVLIALIFWAADRPFAGRASDFGIVIFGLAYLFFSNAIVRTRDAIEVERRVAERDELRQSPPHTPTSLGSVRS